MPKLEDFEADDDDLAEIGMCLNQLLQGDRPIEAKRDALRAMIFFAQDELKKLGENPNPDSDH